MGVKGGSNMKENENLTPDEEIIDTLTGTVEPEKKNTGNDSDGKKGTNNSSDSNTPSEPQKGVSRRRRHALISIATTVFVLVGVVLLNVIANVLTDKVPSLTADMTSLRSFEISDKTKEIAGDVSKRVDITFLSERESYINLDTYCKQTAFLAESISRESEGMVEVKYTDLVRNPSIADDYPGSSLSSTDIIITCGDNSRILRATDIFTFENYSGSYQYVTSSSAEQELDRAILAVTNEDMINTVIVNDYCTEDYSYLVKTLSGMGHKVTELSLADKDIPTNTDFVVVYAPTKDYSTEAVAKLESFLKNNDKYGKSMLFLASSDDADTPNLDGMLNIYSMNLRHGYAFEADSTYINASSSNNFDGVLCQYFSDLYTDTNDQDQRPVIAGYARSIEILTDYNAAPLLSYSEKSGTCPFNADENWKAEENITGRTFVLAQGQNGPEDNPSTIILSGSNKIFTRPYYASDYGNSEYLSTMIETLNGRDTEKVVIPAKVITEFDIEIEPQTAVNIGFIVYALIPIIILGAGFAVFLMRRHR